MKDPPDPTGRSSWRDEVVGACWLGAVIVFVAGRVVVGTFSDRFWTVAVPISTALAALALVLHFGLGRGGAERISERL